MENHLPLHYQENAIFFRQNDYIDFQLVSNGIKTGIHFKRIPNFYKINNKEFYATEIKIEGFKIDTTALVAENILNVRLHEKEGTRQVRNLNFLIPRNVNAKKITIQVCDDNMILVKAPIKKKLS